MFPMSVVAGAMLFASASAALSCEAPDNVSRVRGGSECLVIKTFGRRTDAPPRLVVFIHGDGSSGGASDYLSRAAEKIAQAGVIGVVLIRPGYFDSEKNASTGTSYRNDGDGYPPHIVDSVAAAIQALKAHHGAHRTVLVGHSGGAAISGVILGRYPDIAAAAVLAACPCNIDDWRRRGGKRAWTRSQSPHAFVSAITPGTKVIALTGGADDNTFPVLAKNYIDALKGRGLDGEYIEVAGIDHNRITRTNEFEDAVQRLIAGP